VSDVPIKTTGKVEEEISWDFLVFTLVTERRKNVLSGNETGLKMSS
jgi:hypothetical protein